MKLGHIPRWGHKAKGKKLGMGGGKVMCNEPFLTKHSKEVALRGYTLICTSRAWEENGIGNGGFWKQVSFRGRDGVLEWHRGGNAWSPRISKSLKWHSDFKVFGFMSCEIFFDMKKNENEEEYFIREDAIEYLVGKMEEWANGSGPRKSLCLQVCNTYRIHSSRFHKAY